MTRKNAMARGMGDLQFLAKQGPVQSVHKNPQNDRLPILKR
jgi:hypothetical protein